MSATKRYLEFIVPALTDEEIAFEFGPDDQDEFKSDFGWYDHDPNECKWCDKCSRRCPRVDSDEDKADIYCQNCVRIVDECRECQILWRE